MGLSRPHLTSPYPREQAFSTAVFATQTQVALPGHSITLWKSTSSFPGGMQRRYLWLSPIRISFTCDTSASHRLPKVSSIYLLLSFCECIFLIIFFRLNLITGYGNTTLLIINAGQACSYGKIKVGSAEICGKRKRKRKEDVCKRRNREIQNRNQPRNTIKILQVTITVVVVVDYDSWQPHPTIVYESPGIRPSREAEERGRRKRPKKEAEDEEDEEEVLPGRTSLPRSKNPSLLSRLTQVEVVWLTPNQTSYKNETPNYFHPKGPKFKGKGTPNNPPCPSLGDCRKSSALLYLSWRSTTVRRSRT